MRSQQVRSDSKNLLSGFVFGIMESLIYLIWPSQIKKKVRDAHVSGIEGTCKSNFFGGGEPGSGGRHTGGKKKGAKTVGNLLISTNYLSRKCWKLERICVSK